MKMINYIMKMEINATEYVSHLSHEIEASNGADTDELRTMLKGVVSVLNKMGFVTYVNGQESVVAFVSKSK